MLSFHTITEVVIKAMLNMQPYDFIFRKQGKIIAIAILITIIIIIAITRIKMNMK